MNSKRLRARIELEACNEPHVKRLAAVAKLDEEDRQRLSFAVTTARPLRIGQSISVAARPVFLLSGWACRARVLADGRRQIYSHLLPGDYVQYRAVTGDAQGAMITALVPTVVIDAPAAARDCDPPSLAHAYQALVEHEDHYLHGQILRLGRLTAIERLVHLFCEFAERLRAIDVGNTNQFPLPISQEVIADTLGLTTVHVNRTLQSLRRSDVVKWDDGYVALTDPVVLARRVCFEPTRVASTPINQWVSSERPMNAKFRSTPKVAAGV